MSPGVAAGAVLPARGLRFARLGGSRVGRLLADLLSAQGMEERPISTGAGAPGVDVIVDDRSGVEDDPADTQMWRSPETRVVYIRFTDFPRTHPRWTGRSFLVDELIHAELGLNRMGAGMPEAEPLPIASAYGAMWGAVYAGASLVVRDKTGRGHNVRLPLFSAAVTVMSRRLLSIADRRWQDPLLLPHLPFAEIFECSDGRHVQNHGTFADFVAAFCKAAGREEWREAAIAGLYLLPDKASEDMWRKRLAGVFRERPSLDWERSINALDGACTVCRTHAEWRDNEHARAADVIVGEEATSRVGPAVRVFASQERAANATAWEGAPTAARPLAGLRVIDFALILAGPTCGRTLAEMGADVIKVDAIDRHILEYGWLDVNRGKRSLALDLKRPEGREIARKLVAGAHVVVENLRVGKMEELGLGFHDVLALRPSIVYASLNAFDYGGPWESRAGWEHNAQAATGMQVGRASDGLPRAVPVPVNDYGTGLLGAYAVLLALRHARDTGRGCHVRGSLARTASFVQSEQLGAEIRQPGRVATATRAFQCADGWIRACMPADEADGDLVERLGDLKVMEALAFMRKRDIVAVVDRSVAELQGDRLLDEAGLQMSWVHPHWGAMTQAFAVADAADFVSEPGWPAPDPGENGYDVLRSIGYSEAEIRELESTGAVGPRKPLFK